MPEIAVNDILTGYEISGKGKPLVLIHGAWVSRKMWASQVEHLAKEYKVIAYDVRGHGETGSSLKNRYTIELFTEDLRRLLGLLNIEKPIICGLSMGGMIAQVYASKYPDDVSALVLSDTAVSTELTVRDKIVKYILAPKWLLLMLVRILGVKRYADFAFWYSGLTRNKEWVGHDATVKYIKDEMVKFHVKEFNKIFSALYEFKLQDLKRIKAPTLIINGEYESKLVFKHAQAMHHLIKNSATAIIAKAGHVSNMEKSAEFNMVLDNFLESGSGFTSLFS